jgi:hypothetical protein
MTVKPLALHEQAANGGFTHFIRITADDLTNATLAAAQTFTAMNLVAGDVMAKTMDYVAIPFGVYAAGVLDATFNTTTRSIGDNTVTTHIAAGEANANAITAATTTRLGNTPVTYSAANTFSVTFNSMAAKALSTINRGELHVFVQILRVKQVSAGQTASAISK